MRQGRRRPGSQAFLACLGIALLAHAGVLAAWEAPLVLIALVAVAGAAVLAWVILNDRKALPWVAAGIAIVALFVGGVDIVDRIFPDPKPRPIPEEVEVVWIEDPSALAQIELPELEELAEPEPEEDLEKPEDERKSEEKKKEPKKLKPEKERKKLDPPKVAKVDPPKPPPPKPKPPEVAKVKPPPPPPKPKPTPTPPPPPKQAEKKPKPKLPPKIDRKKMVEVDDEKNVVNDTNYDATYWSDKNRRVKEETRDTQTNLEKSMKGKAVASAESPDRTSPEIGGPDDKVRQNEDSDPTTLDAKKIDTPPTAHNGDAKKAKGVRSGNEGEGGEGGKGGKGGERGTPGALSMRDVQGRGAPGGLGPSPRTAPAGKDDDAPAVAMSRDPSGADGRGGRPGPEGKAGKKGRRGPKLRLEQEDYARIVGDDKVKEEEREVAKRMKSHKKGRWEKKLEQIHSSLENFTPEVKPGNQTALGTRAHPFALYIARMHRTIHEVWGYGFLADLDGKSMSNPMNDRTLAVTMEIVVNPDGSVEKVTIVKPSGVLTFDVAAIDTVMSSGPYEETPEDIRSGDGKVYMHWTFHRDERMCTPYFADPFILDNEKGDKVAHEHGTEPERGLPDPGEEVARRRRESPSKLRRGEGATDGDVEVARVSQEELDAAKKAMGGGMTTEKKSGTAEEGHEGDAARAAANIPTPDDPAAESAALGWANAFEKGDIGALVAASSTPFKSAGTTVAANDADLANVWKNIIEEMPKRRISEWKLFSAAGYRAVFGSLPPGGEDGTAHLYLVVKVAGDRLTLDVAQDANGIYRVIGLTR